MKLRVKLAFSALITVLTHNGTAQPTNNLLTRISMIQSSFDRGTAFSLDVDGREYWITAKHILTGAQHPPYGRITDKHVQLRLLNFTAEGEQWLTVKFSVLDPGDDIDIVVLAPLYPLLDNPPPSVTASSSEIILGGDCEFVGFPYGGGWRATLANGPSMWLPFVKHCTVSALPPSPPAPKFGVLDGINNVGFSGGPVLYSTGAQQKVFAVVSSYLTEPADVIPAPVRKEVRPNLPPPPAAQKGSVDVNPQQCSKQIVNVNAGFIIAFDISYVVDEIHKNPIGPLRSPATK